MRICPLFPWIFVNHSKTKLKFPTGSDGGIQATLPRSLFFISCVFWGETWGCGRSNKGVKQTKLHGQPRFFSQVCRSPPQLDTFEKSRGAISRPRRQGSSKHMGVKLCLVAGAVTCKRAKTCEIERHTSLALPLKRRRLPPREGSGWELTGPIRPVSSRSDNCSISRSMVLICNAVVHDKGDGKRVFKRTPLKYLGGCAQSRKIQAACRLRAQLANRQPTSKQMGTPRSPSPRDPNDPPESTAPIQSSPSSCPPFHPRGSHPPCRPFV